MKMKEFFGAIYDTVFGIHSNDYYEIFQHLYDNGGYLKLGFSFILIPLLCWMIFYFLWKYPYGKLWHWLLWLTFTILVVAGVTYGIANTELFGSNNQTLNELMADERNKYYSYAVKLPIKYALANSLLALVIGALYSILMKQFSKVQIHLPF